MPKLNFIDLFQAIIQKVETKTNISCFNILPEVLPERYFYLSVKEQEPVENKNLQLEEYKLIIHAVSPAETTREMLRSFFQTMESGLELQNGFQVLEMGPGGPAEIQTEASKTRAIFGYNIQVCLGPKAKN